MISNEDLVAFFTYHAPNMEQQARYQAIRAAAITFAKVIVNHTPESADQTAAIRKIREAVMTANASIALENKYDIRSTATS